MATIIVAFFERVYLMQKRLSSVSKRGRGRTKRVYSVNYWLQEISFRKGVRVSRVVEQKTVAKGSAQLKKNLVALSKKKNVLSWSISRF